MKKHILILSLAALFLVASSTQVIADELEQSQKQKQNVEANAEAGSACVAGPYGQCATYAEAEVSVEVEQEQEQKIVYVDSQKEGEVKGVMTHQPVDTAMDTQTTAAAASTIFSGIVALVIKVKKRLA